MKTRAKTFQHYSTVFWGKFVFALFLSTVLAKAVEVAKKNYLERVSGSLVKVSSFEVSI